jgi:hypothetical protein
MSAVRYQPEARIEIAVTIAPAGTTNQLDREPESRFGIDVTP